MITNLEVPDGPFLSGNILIILFPTVEAEVSDWRREALEFWHLLQFRGENLKENIFPYKRANSRYLPCSTVFCSS